MGVRVVVTVRVGVFVVVYVAVPDTAVLVGVIVLVTVAVGETVGELMTFRLTGVDATLVFPAMSVDFAVMAYEPIADVTVTSQYPGTVAERVPDVTVPMMVVPPA